MEFLSNQSLSGVQLGCHIPCQKLKLTWKPNQTLSTQAKTPKPAGWEQPKTWPVARPWIPNPRRPPASAASPSQVFKPRHSRVKPRLERSHGSKEKKFPLSGPMQKRTSLKASVGGVTSGVLLVVSLCVGPSCMPHTCKQGILYEYYMYIYNIADM